MHTIYTHYTIYEKQIETWVEKEKLRLKYPNMGK